VIGLDTNVLVRYIMRDDQEQTAQADRVVKTLTARRPGYVSPVVLAELWWVLGRSYRLSRQQRCLAFSLLLETDELRIESLPSAQKALTMAQDGADFADAMITAMNTASGATMTISFDQTAVRRAGMASIDQFTSGVSSE
jgi:predicted nucleic-acid-binding protein